VTLTVSKGQIEYEMQHLLKKLKTSDGKYFFIGSDCSGWKPNAARSATADQFLVHGVN
jgi:hypothetical protein